VKTGLKRLFVISAFALVAVSTASQAEYPDRSVRTIVPFTPGGNADVTARLIARALTESLGRAFVVENKDGAGGLIGGAVVTQATPDGYTVMFGTGGPIFASSVLAGDKAPYTLKDLQPIGRVSTVPLLLVVNKDSPFHTFAQFEAAAKARPGQIKIGHAGNGTTNDVSVLQLQKALDTKFIIVPYKGSAPSLQDVMTGQLDMASAEATACLQFVTSGQLRALAIVGDKRLAVLPDVPTVGELGLKGVNVTTFAGMLVPIKTPKPIVARLSDALMKAMAEPALQQRLIQLGATPAPLAPKAFAEFLDQEQETYIRLVKEGLLTAE
jgi:tripartite-type tricarboxylate transporter receptor subunit TctC